MTTFDDLVKDYVVAHHDSIRILTEPLHRYLGSTYFTYHRINAHGEYYALVDRPDWAEHYCGSRYYLIDPYLCHPDSYTNGTSLWTTQMRNPATEQIVTDAREIFEMDHGMMVTRRDGEEVEMFGFGAPMREREVTNLYINNLELLHTFCDHFKQAMTPLINQLSEAPVDLLHLKGSDFKRPVGGGRKEQELRRDQFLESLGHSEQVKLSRQLTRRERQVLTLTCQGYSAPGIAEKLGLSHRTVESYLEKTKDKLACLTRAELLAKGHELADLQLLHNS